ncbi:MAG: four-carbon acid sugar kinase family protein [Alphaproteobacteria bacterium]|nr:four-carbon acid sugar kinase family protein [Alphaproteobacteria bacterium]
MLLGCIGDDFTGSSDIANTLARAGMSVTQYCRIPHGAADPSVEAGVVALKSRTVPAAEAVADSLAAADWLLSQGCRQIVFKYCSTFDSTPDGNIGPVAQALAERLGESRVIICPAFPATGRSIYQGHLFVSDVLLSNSGMRNHPLTPMSESDLRIWLARQTQWPVDHIPFDVVSKGKAAIAKALASPDKAMVVIDAIQDQDLLEIGHAATDRKLVTGGSGIALGLPDNFRESGEMQEKRMDWHGASGGGAILCGSCSEATRRQIQRHLTDHPGLEINADRLVEGETDASQATAWLLDHATALPLVYTSADPQVVSATQDKYGRDKVASIVETFFVDIAKALFDSGIRKIVTAGGETSGAVVGGLDIEQLEIGPEIAPGVPAVRDPSSGLCLALKSGNFGQDDFFARAMATLSMSGTANGGPTP